MHMKCVREVLYLRFDVHLGPGLGMLLDGEARVAGLGTGCRVATPGVLDRFEQDPTLEDD